MKKLGFLAILLSCVMFVGCQKAEEAAAPAEDAAAPTAEATEAAPAAEEAAPAAE
ncbi:MAG: hypothetical protein J6A23_14110 [Thermoguttaceae bacterium]|nr:hypothetical protein [Thermoguttaceae bacterium]